MAGKKLKFAAAVFAAILALGAAGCGYVEELEPEQDGAGLVSQEDNGGAEADSGKQFDQNDSDDGGDDTLLENDADDSQAVAPVDESEVDSDLGSDESLADESADSSESGADSEPISGNAYYNEKYGFTLPLPEETTWQEFDDDILIVSFEDDTVQYCPLMETENTDDKVISVQYWLSAKTLDDFAKDAWDRDYRNAGTDENGDTVEILDTSNEQVGGKSAQLVTEKLTGGNGDFYSASLYIEIEESQYIYMHISCWDEASLEELCGYITSTAF